MRLKIIRSFISVLFALIVGSLIYLQLIRGNDYYRLSRNNSIRVVPIESKRGCIRDRSGIILADNRISFDVAVIPQEIRDKEELFIYLSQALQVDKEKLLRTFHQRIMAPFAPVVVAQDISREKTIVLEENKFRFPGLLVRTGHRRYYPFREINAAVLGYVGKINRSRITQLKDYGYTTQSIIGYSGIEEYYDRYLQGQDGGSQIEVNNRGQQVRLLGFKEPIDGQGITLTIDSRVQQMAMDALEGRTGGVIVMDLESDEILAMVSSPPFNPNAFVDGSSQVVSALFSDSNAPLLNRAISGQYPPGSVFKLSVAVAALETKTITPHASFTCPGFYQLGQRRFGCSHTHGLQDLMQGIAHSCNVYFFNTGLLVGPELIYKYARQFGLGSLTNIDLPYEAQGQLKKKSRNQQWYKGDTLNLSIGQGDVLVTPIQLVCMMSRIAQNGREPRPHALKAIGPVEIKDNWTRGGTEISEKTFGLIQSALRAVVSDEAGTAHLLDIEGLNVLGKTGTAETSGGRPSHAWFVGFCPSARARIVFCVFLEYGGASYNACAVAQQLLLKMKEAQIL